MIDFTSQEFQKKYDEIKELETALTHPSSTPTVYILGEQPGAGKTSIQTELTENNSNIIIINADSYRQHHPHFQLIQAQYGDDSPKYTQPFINAVTERLIDELSTEKYNLIVEGTLRTAEVPLKTAKELKEKGYRTELCVMAVKPEISYESTILRYENAIAFGETPRSTSKAHHDMVVERIADNLDTIYDSGVFDCIKIYTRDKGCIYSSDTSALKPSVVEKRILSGEWSDYEKINLNQIINTIMNLKKNRNAADLQEYMSRADKLVKKYTNGRSQKVKITKLSRDEMRKLIESDINCEFIKEKDGVSAIFKKEDAEKVKTVLTQKREIKQKRKPPKR